MKLGIALIAAAFCFAGPAMAQAPSSNTAPPQHTAPGQSAEAPPSLAKPDPVKDKAIRQLMDLMGTSKLGDGMTKQITYQVQEAMSRRLQGDQLSKFMDTFSQKIASRSPDKAVNDAAAAAYASHFSLEEIQTMSQFYGSPAGQKMVQTMPQVIQDAQQAGAPIEREAALASLNDMVTEYPELKDMLPGAHPAPQGAQPPAAPAPAPAPAPSTPHP